jgi:hypothetical protein
MQTDTLANLVEMVRAEAGHALSPAQGLNTEQTIKKTIIRVERELWTAFEWPTLMVREQIPVQRHQFRIAYGPTLKYEQVRQAYWCDAGGSRFLPMTYGIPEEGIKPDGTNNTEASDAHNWEDDGADDSLFRIYPTPSQNGYVRFKGMRPLNKMVNDDDVCTLDSVAIAMRTAAEMLTRAKSQDAELKMQGFQRHIQKLLANAVSNKAKVSTFGSSRDSVDWRRSHHAFWR